MDQNKCAQLEIEDLHSTLDESYEYDQGGERLEQELYSEDTLDSLWKLQKTIQENVYGYNFKSMQKQMLRMNSFFTLNHEAIQDELREFREAMGGMDSMKSALWKPWKKDHTEAVNRSFGELTGSEFEWIDMFHFFLNLAIMIDLTPKEIYNMYHAKNKENINRQKNGY
jgi:hypothetical protein